jgi:hypothetical protein
MAAPAPRNPPLRIAGAVVHLAPGLGSDRRGALEAACPSCGAPDLEIGSDGQRLGLPDGLQRDWCYCRVCCHHWEVRWWDFIPAEVTVDHAVALLAAGS